MFTHRLATVQDLPAIVGIYNSTIASRMVTSDLEPVTVASRQAWFDTHLPHRRPLWVVEEGGEIAGWLSFSDFYGRPAYDGTAELSVYVHEGMRGRGLGRYLVSEAIAHAPQIGVSALLAFIWAHNMPSLALFGQFAFEKWAHMPRVAVLDERACDLVILGRHVQPLVPTEE